MFKSSRLFIAMVLAFFAMVVVTPNIGFSSGDISPDAAAGKGGGKAIKYPCPLHKTGQTLEYASGDDGDLQKGVAWPDPRFTDDKDGTVRDNLTGLIWLKNANCFGLLTWADALSAAATVADGAYGLKDGSKAGDWRLPNERELQSLIDYGRTLPSLPEGHPFDNVQSSWSFYWSSTTIAPPISTTLAWYVLFNLGEGDGSDKTNSFFVWPVRDASQ